MGRWPEYQSPKHGVFGALAHPGTFPSNFSLSPPQKNVQETQSTKISVLFFSHQKKHMVQGSQKSLQSYSWWNQWGSISGGVVFQAFRFWIPLVVKETVNSKQHVVFFLGDFFFTIQNFAMQIQEGPSEFFFISHFCHEFLRSSGRWAVFTKRWIKPFEGFQLPLKQWVDLYNHHCWTLRVLTIQIGSKPLINLMVVGIPGFTYS